MKLLTTVILIVLQWFLLDIFNCNCNNNTAKFSGYKYVKRGQFPFLVFVFIRRENSRDIIYRCSGVIISKEWMMTAAHCVYDSINKTFYDLKDIQIIAGSVDLQDSKTWQVHECLRTIPYKDYGQKELGRHDFCLLQVVRPFYLRSKYVGKIAISNHKWPENTVKKRCIVIGWKNNENTTSTNLQYGRTKAKRGLKACKCTLKHQVDTLICIKRHSICYGSGGSPLLCDGKLVGLAHANFDKHCENNKSNIQTICKKTDEYCVYTYLLAYKVWISQYIPVLFDRKNKVGLFAHNSMKWKHYKQRSDGSDRVVVVDNFSDQLIIYLCLLACCNISLKGTNYAACNLLLLLSAAI